MNQEQRSVKLQIEGVSELWLKTEDETTSAEHMFYRPAILVECTLVYRSLRAGLNHSEERNFTAWLPKNDLAIDWETSAVEFIDTTQISSKPNSQITYEQREYNLSRVILDQFEAELIDTLARKERLRLYRSPEFNLYSTPGQSLEDFLAETAEAALHRIEPDLRKLRNKFELQIEQLREALSKRGRVWETTGVEGLVTRKLQVFESENRISSMFSILAGTVFGSSEPRQDPAGQSTDWAELREDLERVEHEASVALKVQYENYLALAKDYDIYEIGLQPDNIRVMRVAILWVPAPMTGYSHK